MTDEEVRTIVETDDDTLEFQRYFVEQRCRPRVRSLWFAGACRTRVSAAVSRAIFDASRAIVICPSNPYLSIDPILSIPGMRAALHQATAPIVAISPIIGGQAVKGPTAKIMSELGLPVTNVAIAEHYRGLIDGLIVDAVDADDAPAIDVPVHVARTLMEDLADRVRLAREALAFAETLAASRVERVIVASHDGRGICMTSTDVWAVVLVKPFRLAKQRLADVLDAGERAELARVMLADVLTAVEGVRSPGRRDRGNGRPRRCRRGTPARGPGAHGNRGRWHERGGDARRDLSRQPGGRGHRRCAGRCATRVTRRHRRDDRPD